MHSESLTTEGHDGLCMCMVGPMQQGNPPALKDLVIHIHFVHCICAFALCLGAMGLQGIPTLVDV